MRERESTRSVTEFEPRVPGPTSGHGRSADRRESEASERRSDGPIRSNIQSALLDAGYTTASLPPASHRKEEAGNDRFFIG